MIDIDPAVPRAYNNPIDYSNKDTRIPELIFERQDADNPPTYPDLNAIFCSQCNAP